jgi:hypothetical protein
LTVFSPHCSRIFPPIVGVLAIWSLSSSFLIHLHCQDQNLPLRKWIIASNIFGVIAPLIHLVIFMPLDVIAGRRYARTVELFFDIDAALRSKAAEWTPSPTPNLLGLLDIVPLFEDLEAEFVLLRPIWQAN